MYLNIHQLYSFLWNANIKHAMCKRNQLNEWHNTNHLRRTRLRSPNAVASSYATGYVISYFAAVVVVVDKSTHEVSVVWLFHSGSGFNVMISCFIGVPIVIPCRARVGKVRPAGQIRPASSVDPARGNL